MVGSVNDWQKERQFQALNEKKEERGVKVIRAGVEHVIDVHEVVVGDIALVEPGEIIPCDGVFLNGQPLPKSAQGGAGLDSSIVSALIDTVRPIQSDYMRPLIHHNRSG